MDWRSVTFDWNRARAFLVTAEEGSLSAAARALGMTQPTLGRQVTALEEQLGLTLFDRAGRGLVLTDAGARLLDQVRAMGEAAAAVSLVAGGQATELSGPVAITCTEIYASWLLPPVLHRLAQEAPGLRIEIVASNDVRDLKRREADIAIRNARPDQPDLIGKRIAEDAAGFFASAAYLDQLGPTEQPDSLSKARMIGFDENASFIAALNKRGVPVTEENFAIRATSHAVHLDMARRGLGIGICPIPLGESDTALERVLPEISFGYPVWLVAHRELRTSPRVRLVWDILAEMLPGLLRG